MGGVERQKTSKLSEKALNLPSYLGGQIDLIMSSFMGLKTGMNEQRGLDRPPPPPPPPPPPRPLLQKGGDTLVLHIY